MIKNAIFNSKLLVITRGRIMPRPQAFRNGSLRLAGGLCLRWRQESDELSENPSFWVNYNDLTIIIVSKGNDPQMALVQVSEIL